MNKKNEKVEKKSDVKKVEIKKVSSFSKKKKVKKYYLWNSLCLFNI